MTKSKSTAGIAPFVVEASSISSAWATIFLHVIENAGTEIAPLVISVDSFEEDPSLRKELDLLLAIKQKTSVENVAFTIFPQRYWQIARGDRTKLFDLYGKTFGRIQARNRSLNGRGLYFQRMTMYNRGPCNGNQLEWIISQYNRRTGVRRSMLQATVFDAGTDHVSTAQLGFPCLQHVSFEPTEAGLVLNAFYATQQIFDKAYGNYLGLAQLGHFVAGELEMKLCRLNVMVGVAKLERITKNDPVLSPTINAAKILLETETQLNTEAA